MTNLSPTVDRVLTARGYRKSRVGSKGQVVITKELRRRYGIKEGTLVEQIPDKRGVLIVPLNAKELMQELEEAAREIGKTWPRILSAVEAISRDRER